MISFSISFAEDNQTAISFLKKRLRNTPLSLIHKLIRKKSILLNGKRVKQNYRLKTGEVITITDTFLKTTEPEKNSEHTLEEIKKATQPLTVVLEDENILIVDKPHNLGIEELNERVNSYYAYSDPISYQKLKEHYFSFSAAHQLDKLTRGLVIYAKNSLSQRLINQVIDNKGQIVKKYLAKCEWNSQQKPLAKFIAGYITKNDSRKRMEFSQKPHSEISSQSCAMIIEERKRDSNLPKKERVFEVTLQTGRKHQIRSIFSFFHYPIIGDFKYGGKNQKEKKIELYAYQITFKQMPAPLEYLNNKLVKIDLSKVLQN